MKARRWVTWLVFGICALALLEALGWVTWQALRLEQREREARAEAQFQESIRTALWRMEGEMTPILAKEAGRPYFEYLPFYAPERAYTEMWQEIRPEELKVPSPLLLEHGSPYVKLYFQEEPDTRVTSPQVPTGPMRQLAEAAYMDPEFLMLSEERLKELRPMLAAGWALARPMPSPQVAQVQAAYDIQQQSGGQRFQIDPATEYLARRQAAQTANTTPMEQKRGAKSQLRAELDGGSEVLRDRSASPAPASTYTRSTAEVRQGALEAQWLPNPANGEHELILHRRVDLQIGTVRQGFWMDWPLLRSRLREVIQEVLPGADLQPATRQTLGLSPASHLMASIPVLIVPGEVPAVSIERWTPVWTTLAVTWLAVLAALWAIAVVLRKSMELSDRRGRFVSAVTHELRTPLTTFCLYTEMLSDGMVSDEGARQGYLSTLKGESRRLAGIVENVLEYARLGGKKPPPSGTPIFARDILSRIEPSLVRCAERCSMQLVREGSPDPTLRVTADTQTVERILLNLVDNACKYAGDAADRRVHLKAASLARGGRAFLELRVRDHGPGIPPGESARIFRPFQRGKRSAGEPKSGLGLGLALARGLARELGGDLKLNPEVVDGAEFILTIPA